MAEAALILTAISAASSISQGISAKKSADRQAEQLQEQSRLAAEEAEQEATRKEEERRRTIAKQKVAFLANGVGLSGSANAVINETVRQFDLEIDAIRRSGRAQSRSLANESEIKKKSGRAQLISGFGNAATTIGTSSLFGEGK